MKGVSLISLGSLLLFNHRTSATAANGSSSCIGIDQLNSRAVKLRRIWDLLSVSKHLLPPEGTRTCARTAEGTHKASRSLSPWTYRIHEDVHRLPSQIMVAECLCQGCIINQREDLSHNSVPVFAPLMVLRKVECPLDPQKFVVKRDVIKIPVACTCVVPRYSK